MIVREEGRVLQVRDGSSRDVYLYQWLETKGSQDCSFRSEWLAMWGKNRIWSIKSQQSEERTRGDFPHNSSLTSQALEIPQAKARLPRHLSDSDSLSISRVGRIYPLSKMIYRNLNCSCP